MIPVVLVILVVLEVPYPEIRILQEISSPELAGNRRKTRFRSFPGVPGGFRYSALTHAVQFYAGKCINSDA